MQQIIFVPKYTDIIAYRINRLPKGYVFTYEDFWDEVKSKEAIIKTLNRMVATGKVNKLSKGRYYKPEKTPFGELSPTPYQTVKDLLEEDGKPIGYLTGYSIYPSLGLTTQISNTIQIGRNAPRPGMERGKYTIQFVLQKNPITADNIPLLQLLDAIRYLKKIPDTTPTDALQRLKALIAEKTKDERSAMVRLAKKYPPSARAVLGALLELENNDQLAAQLANTLNPITKYNLSITAPTLPNAEKWNII